MPAGQNAVADCPSPSSDAAVCVCCLKIVMYICISHQLFGPDDTTPVVPCGEKKEEEKEEKKRENEEQT